MHCAEAPMTPAPGLLQSLRDWATPEETLEHLFLGRQFKSCAALPAQRQRPGFTIHRQQYEEPTCGSTFLRLLGPAPALARVSASIPRRYPWRRGSDFRIHRDAPFFNDKSLQDPWQVHAVP